MEIRPILTAMRRNKVGAILIALQMAVTLAIVCNALFIIQQRLALSQRPTGADEADVFGIDNQWVGEPENLGAKAQADLAVLRSLPDVADAYVSNTYPLTDSGWSDGVKLQPGQLKPSALTALYMSDEHTLSTLGLRLVAGRNFNASEVIDRTFNDRPDTPVIIITRALADKLFPDGDALGKSVYVENTAASRIIGIVDRLQVPWTSSGSWATNFVDNSTLAPFRYISQNSRYVLRAKAGRLAAAMKSAQQGLIGVDRARVLSRVRSLTQARAEIYRDDHGLAVVLAVVCAALLAVTAFGIVGLTSYWVAQRRRQIGIRRALGATKSAIASYFQTENLLIAVAGSIAGAALAIAVNLWMVSSFSMERLHNSYTVVGVIAVLGLGQLATLWPALRASSIPPALAARGV